MKRFLSFSPMRWKRKIQVISHAVGVVAKAKGMTEIAEKSGISRKSLYGSIGENSNPTLEPLIPVLPALGVKVTPMLSHSS